MIRKSLRETLADNQRAMENLAKITGKPMPEGYKEMTSHLIKPKVEKRPSLYGNIKPAAKLDKPPVPLESEISKSIAQYLAAHTKVKFAVRQNSGAARIGELDSRPILDSRLIWFYKFAARKGVDMRITDYWGMLTDGRMFAIEVKRPGWKKPTDKREREQANFIEVVGLGGFVTCVEDVERLFK